MWSVRILYDVPGWAYYNNGRDLQKYAPPDFRVSLGRYLENSDLPEALGSEEPDFLVLNRTPSAAVVRKALDARGWTSKLVVSWSIGWPRRIEHLGQVLKYADLINFVNDSYWRNVGKPDKSICVPIGVDVEVFRNLVPFEDRPRRLLWMGSQINGSLKGYDAVAVPLRKKLTRDGFECDFRVVDSFSSEKFLSQREMVDWYNTGRVLVCTSSSEGTPNVALEAAACGCAVITTPVGNMPELIRHGENGMLVDHGVDAFHQAILESEERWPSMARALEKDIAAWSWERRANEFFSALRDMTNSSAKAAVPAKAAAANGSGNGVAHANGKSHPVAVLGARTDDKIDLSDRVTVFVTTVGAPTYETCMRLLEQQDCRFRLQVIANVAPMDVAFQKMLDDCQTEFYVQVDEDMLLYPHAVQTLYQRMIRHAPNIALRIEYLYDTHIRKFIQGVKIFRHDIVKRYPFRDIEGCEVDQVARFQSDGFEFAANYPPEQAVPYIHALGLHGTNYTRETAYLRYFVLQRRHRRRSSDSWRMLTPDLSEQFRKEPTEINFFALMGSLAGMSAPFLGQGHEKDFRAYAETPGFQELTQFYDAIKGRRKE